VTGAPRDGDPSLLVNFQTVIVSLMTTAQTDVEIMLQDSDSEDFLDVEASLIYSSKDPLAIKMVFLGVREWLFAVDYIQHAANGESCGVGDVRFDPEPRFEHCMRLTLSGAKKDEDDLYTGENLTVTMVISRGDLKRAWSAISEVQATVSNSVRKALNKALRDILGD
jgi:hypothetical protein